MPAQPPFFTPTRTPTSGLSAASMISRTRAAAASVSDITFSLRRGAAIVFPCGGSFGYPAEISQIITREAKFERAKNERGDRELICGARQPMLGQTEARARQSCPVGGATFL